MNRTLLRVLIALAILLSKSVARGQDPTPAAPLIDPSPAAQAPKDNTTYPRDDPYRITVCSTSQIQISLSMLPEVRIIGVLDNARLGKQIPLVWDPQETPRLSYRVTVEQGDWLLSFRSEPLYRTGETTRLDSEDRISLTYRPVEEKSPGNTQQDSGKAYDEKCKQPQSGDPSKGESILIRLQPFNLFDYTTRAPVTTNWYNRKQDIIVHVYTIENIGIKEWAHRKYPGLIGDSASEAALNRAFGRDFFEEQHSPPDQRSVSKSIERMGASEWRAATGRSLSDPVPQVVLDLFGILAEIAFDRAKAKSFSLLSEQAIKLACTDLKGSVLREGLDQAAIPESRLWWLPSPESLLLPQTCETLRGLRIQELATAGKSIYGAVVRDITAFPLSILPKLTAKLSSDILDLKGMVEMARVKLNSGTPVCSEPAALPAAKDDIKALADHLAALASPDESLAERVRAAAGIPPALDHLRSNACIVDTVPEHKPLRAVLTNQLLSLKAELGDVPSLLLVPPLMHALAVVVKGVVESNGQLGERDVQVAFLTFAKEFAQQTDSLLPIKTAPKAVICPVRLALAVISECQSRGGCDALAISEYLRSPEVFLDDEQCPIKEQRSWPEISQFISRALEVVRPNRATPPAAQLRSVTNLIFDIAEFVLAKQQNRRFPLDASSLKAMRNILTGALDQEAQDVLVGFSQLIGNGFAHAAPLQQETKGPQTLRKLSALAAAVASYAKNYASGDEHLDEKQAKAQREARKKAIESMMDLTTQRSERANEFIVSLGINPGFHLLGAQAGPGATGKSNAFYTQLTLPTGVALQWLAPRLGKHLGFHMQFSVLDLAQFVSFDGQANRSMTNLTWSDFVTVGLQLGFLIGKSPNAQFFLGTDFRYAPSLSFQDALADDANAMKRAEYDRNRGVFRGGVSIGYYVPFFDFN